MPADTPTSPLPALPSATTPTTVLGAAPSATTPTTVLGAAPSATTPATVLGAAPSATTPGTVLVAYVPGGGDDVFYLVGTESMGLLWERLSEYPLSLLTVDTPFPGFLGTTGELTETVVEVDVETGLITVYLAAKANMSVTADFGGGMETRDLPYAGTEADRPYWTDTSWGLEWDDPNEVWKLDDGSGVQFFTGAESTDFPDEVTTWNGVSGAISATVEALSSTFLNVSVSSENIAGVVTTTVQGTGVDTFPTISPARPFGLNAPTSPLPDYDPTAVPPTSPLP